MTETVDELTPETFGRWRVKHASGSTTIWVLDPNRQEFMRITGGGALMPGDGVLRAIRWVLAWPKVGYHARVELWDGSRHTCTETAKIERLELPFDVQGKELS